MAVDDTAETVRHQPTLAAKVLWFFGASGIHLILWSVLFVLLYAYVPHQKAILDDFGVATSAATRGVIDLSEFVVNYWYLAAPLVTTAVLVVDGLAIFLSRSTTLRLALVLLLTLPPVVLVVASYVFPQYEVSKLMEELS
jgi:type II secretory pathway component PulF